MDKQLRSLWDMYKVDGAAFHEAMTILQQVISLADNISGNLQLSEMTAENRTATVKMLERFGDAIKVLNVPVTELTLEDTLTILKSDDEVQYIGCGQLLLELSKNLGRELTTVKMFALDPIRANLYESAIPPYGNEVANKFPSIAYDIDQAAKCYACDLTTASVFHSIRCLEAGIRAMTRCLSIPDPTRGAERNWSIVLRKVKEEIDKKWTAPNRLSGDGQIFEELHGSLAAIQNPYRNATMHLDATYTAPDAIYLFELVKGLMKKIASRMDENGLPLA